MIEFKTFATGLVLGGVFAFLKAEIPAPMTLAGVLGIVGVWLGYRGIHELL